MGAHPGDVRLPAVERTVDLIQLLSCSNRELTLSEICRAIGIPKSSAHYLIQTLLARGFLFCNRDYHTYSLGSRVPELFGHSRAVQELRNALREDLHKLAGVTRLTATATVLRGAQAVHIEIANPPAKESTGGFSNWVGRHIDVHCTAQGKIHLAYLSEMEFDKLLQERSLAKFTPKTICSKATLRTHLVKVRSDGFALNDEEHIVGVRGIAAPIFGHIGCTIAAIGVTGSVQEMPRERIPTMVEQVASAAIDVSRRFVDWFPAKPSEVPSSPDRFHTFG